jgi:hypothetical protein
LFLGNVIWGTIVWGIDVEPKICHSWVPTFVIDFVLLLQRFVYLAALTLYLKEERLLTKAEAADW